MVRVLGPVQGERESLNINAHSEKLRVFSWKEMQMGKFHRTAKGTELPVLNLKGKDYLEVKYRLVWFREDHPSWSIETDFVSVSEKSACAKAVIRDEQGRVISTSHKFENERGFPDFMEKAETGAIGRALALIGYGTQFCGEELDEGSRIVDSPVDRSGLGASSTMIPTVTSARSEALPLERAESEEGDEASDPGLRRAAPIPGDFQVPFGRKYKGKKVSEIPQHEIESYLAWLEADAEKKRAPLSFEVKLLKKAVEMHYGTAASAAASE